MPFQINLDACILESTRDFPYILGNLMVNDYLRGIDPEKEHRYSEEEYLALFSDLRDHNQRDHHMSHRTITQHSCNEKGYATDPRGAGLAYSKWLNKWYIGMGRAKVIFEGLMANIGRMKILLREDGVDHTDVFSQKIEEAIIKSFERCVLPDASEPGGEAIEWYRAALPHNKVHCLELAFDEHIFPKWDVEPLGWEDPGVRENQTGVTVPIHQADTFADQQVHFLTQCFGRESDGAPGELFKQPVGKLIERVLGESIAKLVTVGLENEQPFDLQRTYIEDLAAEEMYSAHVCIGSYIHMSDLQFVVVQPSMAALEGIALCTPGSDALNATYDLHSRNPQYADLVKLRSVYTGPNFEDEIKWLLGVRTDLYRLLKASGFTGAHDSFSFIQNYTDGNTDHYGVEAMCLYPAENLATSQRFAFWPHPNPKVDRGFVPRDCIRGINGINQALVNWANGIRGFQSIGVVVPPFDPRFPRVMSDKNSNAPAPLRPEAVRPVSVETNSVINAIELATGKKIKRAREFDIMQDRQSTAWTESEAQLNQVRVSLEGERPIKKMRFFSDEPQEDPTTPPTKMSNQAWVWGLLILLLLGLVTYRKL